MDAVQKIYRFYQSYGGEKRIIGASACGLPIVALFAGRHEYPQLIVQYGIHGREWVTSLLAPEHLLFGLTRGGAWFVPLADPDGALLSMYGEEFLKQLPPNRARFLRAVNGENSFSLWKANGNAVDLNVNFPAGWGEGVRNVRAPAPENYIGRRPLSEPESAALYRFTLDVRPDATISYHTKGEEIYWEYFQQGERLCRDELLARALAAETGYAAKRLAGSGGGYKDFCIRALKIPAFTIEAGRDSLSHPLGEGEFYPILAKNIGVVRRLSEELWKTR